MEIVLIISVTYVVGRHQFCLIERELKKWITFGVGTINVFSLSSVHPAP